MRLVVLSVVCTLILELLIIFTDITITLSCYTLTIQIKTDGTTMNSLNSERLTLVFELSFLNRCFANLSLTNPQTDEISE